MERERSKVERMANNIIAFGCLGGLVAPFIALAIFPRGKWLFLAPFVAFALLILLGRFRKPQTPQFIAGCAEELLEGGGHGFAVDDYEGINPSQGPAYDLWRETFRIGGLPEDWPQLDEWKKEELRQVIAKLRALEPRRS